MQTLSASRQQFVDLVHALREREPAWDQRRLISEMRRAIPAYSRGVWRLALPFDQGLSRLPDDLRERLVALRELSTRADGIDLGHILTSLDVRLCFDLVDDTYISWAGDLGSHVLDQYDTGSDLPVGSPDSYAGMTDLLGDIDGDNIARHARPGHELDDALAYYGLVEPLPDMPVVERRYQTFLSDLGLLQDGRLVPNAAAPEQVLYAKTREFVLWDSLEPHLIGHRLAEIIRRVQNPDGSPSLDRLIHTAVRQFAELLAKGLARENERTA